MLKEFGKSLHIRVSAQAAANMIKIEALPNGNKLIKVYVTAAAEDGKANKAVLKLLAKELGLPISALTITRGLASRDKIININTKENKIT